MTTRSHEESPAENTSRAEGASAADIPSVPENAFADAPGTLRVLLVDDEPPARDRLRRLLERIGGCTVAGEASTGTAAVAAIEELEPDVVLLDINLPDLSGLRVLEALDDPPAVIFCTAYAEHAVRAFDLEAVDYLLKPFSADRLRRALDRTRRLLAAPLPPDSERDSAPESVPASRPEFDSRAHPAAESAASPPADPGTQLHPTSPPHPVPPARVAACDGRATALVPVEAIISLRVEEGVTFLLRDDGERLICEEPLRDLEATLPPALFFRANRQAIVNLAAVLSFTPTPDGGLRLQLRTGGTEQVSRRRTRHFRHRIRPTSTEE